MTEEIYTKKESIDLIKEGTYKDIQYYITSLGHPCAYIVLDKDHPFCKDDPLDYGIVHGGITWFDNKLEPLFDFTDEHKMLIGWDYNHYGDCSVRFNCEGKKYSVGEIMQDVERIINYVN